MSSRTSALGDIAPRSLSHLVMSVAGFELVELVHASGLRAQVLPNGALHAFRHGDTLINQFLPGPAEEGLFRLLLRRHGDAGSIESTSLVGPGLPFGADASGCAWTAADSSHDFKTVTTLRLPSDFMAWSWRVAVSNTGVEPLRFDVVLGQDIGIADIGAVRNNEAYVSQYIDLQALPDPRFGPVVFARQNQPAAGGRHPWLATACLDGAVAYCTDGWQFFGHDHRLTGRPAASGLERLPSKRLQYEFALAGLQSKVIELAPGEETSVTFVARFVADHPGATSEADMALVHEMVPDLAEGREPVEVRVSERGSCFTQSAWCHGREPTPADLVKWFGGIHRHVEWDDRGEIMSFFADASTHVVCRAKEAIMARPHGHILRSGNGRWIDEDQFGVTAYAAGIFGAQSYLGNPSLTRLLSVVRNQLNVARASGQRVFIRDGDKWMQLGVPSVWAVSPGEIRWIYELPERTIEARVWCSAALPASYLDLRVTQGAEVEFLVTHHLVLGANEFDDGAEVTVAADHSWASFRPEAGRFAAKHVPNLSFAIAAGDPTRGAVVGGDELIYEDGEARNGPYFAVRSAVCDRCAVVMLGSYEPTELSATVEAARAELQAELPAAEPPKSALRLHGDDAGVGRLDEILPWFTHNAGIHFSAPHGLDQYGGAAWGVRDVTQGSVEWLLASGEYATVRRVLITVFAQQYAADGAWPQWFMFPPFAAFQQNHSHGDVCFWPVKALCDYIEASNDLEFLQTVVGYTDHESFGAVGPAETLWQHCDRVVDQAESRFVPGTALVNYGDGDWDDTLQPADPAMRTRMVSAWTVGLAFHTFRQLAEVSRRAGRAERATRLTGLLERMRADFTALLMPGGVVAGFMINEDSGVRRPLLHPTDVVTGIRYRLLPMTRAILAELFTPEQALSHMDIVDRELRYSDGVRLMSEPAVYRGGLETLFKRAETAANLGREIGLQYVHAHIRYAEAMARLGDAERLWWALQVINPVELAALVPTASIRQSNVYFSSSDADFDDRIVAAERWSELREGKVAVRGGWRLYSSGPGLIIHKVRSCLVGLRESFGDVIFDPVLPKSLNGMIASVTICGRPVEMIFHVKDRCYAPRRLVVNGVDVDVGLREVNPYRTGGLRIAADRLGGYLKPRDNQIEIEL